jgi:hypothetical protein
MEIWCSLSIGSDTWQFRKKIFSYLYCTHQHMLERRQVIHNQFIEIKKNLQEFTAEIFFSSKLGVLIYYLFGTSSHILPLISLFPPIYILSYSISNNLLLLLLSCCVLYSVILTEDKTHRHTNNKKKKKIYGL